MRRKTAEPISANGIKSETAKGHSGNIFVLFTQGNRIFGKRISGSVRFEAGDK